MKRGKLSEDFVDSDSDLDAKDSVKHVKEAKLIDSHESKSSVADKLTSEEVSFEISAKRKITVRKFRSNVLIDIREFYEDKGSGEMRPGSKGIALTKEQYLKLKELFNEIDYAIKKIE